MNVSLKQDTSYLFNSMNRSVNTGVGVAGLASLVSDYNTIKNGSYNKLVKAYYAKMGEDDSSSTVAKSGKSTTTDDLLESKIKGSTSKAAASKEYTKISSDASALKDAVSALSTDAKDNVFAKGEDGKVDSKKIGDAVNSFVDKYNALIKSAGNSENNTVRTRAEMMTSLSTANFNQLHAVGITLGEDGKLSVDADKLASADTGKLESLFSGRNSYGDRVSSYAGFIETGAANAANNATTYNASGVNNQNYSSLWSSLA